MRAEEFEYFLPDQLIARKPIEPRDAARLLVDIEGFSRVSSTVASLSSFLRPGDCLVRNTTKVLPARIRFRRASGGSAEVLLLEPRNADEVDSHHWEALVRPSAKLKAGIVEQVDSQLSIRFGADLGEGRREIELLTDLELHDALARAGEMPLPPYLGSLRLEDDSRYQTIFAERPASAAAPTAGLHFTQEVFADLSARQVQVAEVELIVGLGTFRPIVVDDLGDHQMHSERYRITEENWDLIHRTRRSGGRIVALGTTSVRALESAALTGQLTGSTALFISRGFQFQLVDLLLTNFHLSRSSLLVMIDALYGPRWRSLYEHAIENNYRFLSFGDAMLIERWNRTSTGPSATA